LAGDHLSRDAERFAAASYAPGQYLAFLGRLAPEKGPEAAIRIAKNCGMPPCIAAKIPLAEKSYSADVIAPQAVKPGSSGK